MMANVLLTLPIPGSGCDDIRVVAEGADLLVEYQYGERGVTEVGSILFDWAIAYRFWNEKHSPLFEKRSYDTLVEITESSWLRELKEEGQWRHFAVFFSNIGYLEVVASDFKPLPDREGTLTA